MKIIVSDFCRETYFKNPQPLTPEEVLADVIKNFDQSRPAYREGVIYVPLSPEFLPFFKCPIAQLQHGDYVFGRYTSRVIGEEPRKKLSVLNAQPMPCLGVDVVLYAKHVLAEDGGNTEPDADWEIITVLPKPVTDEIPLPVETLLYNHFHGDGGTKTGWTPEQFEAAIKKSFEFWKDKAHIYET